MHSCKLPTSPYCIHNVLGGESGTEGMRWKSVAGSFVPLEAAYGHAAYTYEYAAADFISHTHPCCPYNRQYGQVAFVFWGAGYHQTDLAASLPGPRQRARRAHRQSRNGEIPHRLHSPS